MHVAARAWPWLAGGVALAAANLWLVAYDVNQLDESWTVQVVNRLLEGDALYRDIWFGTTPLSIYLLQGVAALVGAQILLVKVLAALVAAGAALVVARIALQAGVTRSGALALALLTLPLAPAAPVSLYTPLAMLFFLACESVAVTAALRPRTGRTGAVAVAGTMAGLAFASKQNVGLLAIAALVVTVVLTEPARAGLRRAAVAVAVFAGVAVATVAAMVATGGVRNTLDALGLGKGEYLEHGAVHYHRTLLDRLEAATRAQTWLDQLAGHDRDLVVATPKVLLPIAAAFLLTAAWVAWAAGPARPRRLEPRLVAVTAFALASFLAAFPRYETIHLAWVAGPLLIACGVSLTFLRVPPVPALRVGAAGIASAWALFVVLGPLADWRHEPVRLGLPHFDGVWTSPETRATAAASVLRLQDALPGRAIFLVVPSASFYYLGAGLENPTRYDFPALTVIGDSEADEILGKVRDGTVPAVCLADERPRPDDMRPLELEARLRLALRAGPDVGPCRLWFPDGSP